VIERSGLLRTARLLFDGTLYVPSSAFAAAELRQAAE
jgi:2-methylaconitate cis-trans-isomerase PrpF